MAVYRTIRKWIYVPPGSPDDARRRKLLNILLAGMASIALLGLLAMRVAGVFGLPRDNGAARLDQSLFAVLIVCGIIYAINRYWAEWVAGSLFVLLLAVIIVVADEPMQVVQGRSVFLFSVPILVASVVLRPWASFAAAGLSSLVLALIALGLPQYVPPVPSMLDLLAIALVAWLGARSLEQALRDLRASEVRYRAVVEDQSELICRFRPDGTITFVNAAFCRYFNLGSREAVGRDVKSLMAEVASLDAECDEFLAAICSLTPVQTFECPAVVGKKRRWIQWTSQAIPDDAHGRAIEHQAVGRDVTERVQAEEALLESETRFRNIVESTPLGMHMYQLEPGRRLVFTGANPAADEILGVDNAQFVGQTIEQAFRALAETDVPERYRLAASEGVPWHSEQIDYVEGQIEGAFEVWAFQTSPGRMVAAFTDITERLRSGKALRESEGLYRTLIETSPDAITLTDPEGRILAANRQFLALYGFESLDEIQAGGWTAFDLVVQEDRQRVADNAERTFREGTLRSIEYTMLRKDGSTFPIEVDTSAVFGVDGEPHGFIAIGRDITERRRIEERLRQAQRMEAMGRLAAGVAHDFNNYLTVMDSYTGLLLDDLSTDDPRRRDVEQIARAVELSCTLVGQLLAFSRTQVLSPRVLCVNDAIADAEDVLRRLAGRDVELVVECAPDAGLVRADPGQVEQVLLNLVTNARDAIPGIGTITIRTVNVEVDQVDGESVEPMPYVMISVSDTGVGMDEGTRARIFEPFFTTKENGTGTGLGLSTVYGIVRQSGGHIRVHSEPGRGTTFEVCLPRILAR
jgi:PAS domain S-box-containing protein